MKERFIGGFFVAAVMLIALFSGGIVMASILMVVSILGIYELLKVYALEKSRLAFIDYAATILFYGLLYYGKETFLVPMVILLLMVLLTVYVFSFPAYKDLDIMKALYGFIYISVFLSYAFRIREMKHGLFLSLFILIASWANDIFAYFTGRALGKHKLSPIVSPNKSVEGFIGGIAGAAVLGVAYGVVFPQYTPVSKWACGLLMAIASVPSVIGDLAASAIKRNNDIKDYSKLIPGHGGVLDRIDSVLFVSPIIYYGIRILLQ